MIHCPIPTRHCVSSAITASSSRRVCCLLRLALLLGLLVLRILAVQGQQSPQESVVCTVEPQFILVGLTSSPVDDAFGSRTSLSLDGTIAAIGVPDYNNNSGYVLVFRWANNVWTQLGSTIFGDNSTITTTNALSDDGSILAVGGGNTINVRIFRLVDDDWELYGSITTNPSGDFIGWALAISGDGTILAASFPYADGEVDEDITYGKVAVFEFVGGSWIQKGRTLQAEGEEQNFGHGLALSQDGSRLAVGIPDSLLSLDTNGFVRVFEFIDNDWVQIGQALQGTSVGERFGAKVSLSSDGQTLAVSAPKYSGYANNSGSVHVYRYGSDGQWFEPGAILFGKSAEEEFGRSLALSGNASILVASARMLLRVFEAYGNEWIEVGEEGTSSSDQNNAAISRDGSTAMGGANVFDVSCQQRTTTGTMVKETFSGISLTFKGVTTMRGTEIEKYELLTKEWYEAFFDERSGRVLQSLLRDVRDMQTTIEVANQNVYLSEDGLSVLNEITYKQTIEYTAESNNVDANDYINLPFDDVDAYAEYGKTLKSELDAFQDLKSPLPTPQFDSVPDADGDDDDGEGIAIGVIVGASVGGAVFFAIAVFVGIRVKHRKDDAGDSLRAAHWPSTSVESRNQTSAQRSQGQSLACAAGAIVYDGHGEILEPGTLAAQAVYLPSDNPTTLQNHTTGVLKPSPPQNVIDTQLPELQFKDQTRSSSPESHAQLDP